MALTDLEYEALRTLRGKNLLPQDGHILELGESNWYGDVALEKFLEDIKRFSPHLMDRVEELKKSQEPTVLWDVAKVCWDMFFAPKRRVAIDFNGTDQALKIDLNHPIAIEQTSPDLFDVVMNIGTLEHVFNIAQGFRTVHEYTRDGGIMLHSLPFIGWPDHGFYNVHPTLFFDLAYANKYEILYFSCGEIEPLKQVMLTSREDVVTMIKEMRATRSRMLCCVMKKTSDAPFKTPWQGYYAGTLPEGVHKAWHSLR